MNDQIKLPSVEDLEKLPTKLRVAYAVRAAMRVVSFVEDQSQKALVSDAIQTAVNFATGETADRETPNGLARVSNAAKYASNKANKIGAHAASHAAQAAANATFIPIAPNGALVAANAAEEAIEAVEVEIGNSAAIRFACASDYQTLLKLSESSDHLSVDLKLWPASVPVWFENPTRTNSDESKLSGRILITAKHDFVVDPESDEIATGFANLIKAMSAYHIALGGNGLVLDDIESRVLIGSPVEV